MLYENFTRSSCVTLTRQAYMKRSCRLQGQVGEHPPVYILWGEGTNFTGGSKFTTHSAERVHVQTMIFLQEYELAPPCMFSDLTGNRTSAYVISCLDANTCREVEHVLSANDHETKFMSCQVFRESFCMQTHNTRTWPLLRYSTTIPIGCAAELLYLSVLCS